MSFSIIYYQTQQHWNSLAKNMNIMSKNKNTHYIYLDNFISA